MFGIKKAPKPTELTLTELLTTERSRLAPEIKEAISHALDGRCETCLRVKVTDEAVAYYDRVDPKNRLPLEATEHLCWEFDDCYIDPEDGLTEDRLRALAVLKVLDSHKG